MSYSSSAVVDQTNHDSSIRYPRYSVCTSRSLERLVPPPPSPSQLLYYLFPTDVWIMDSFLYLQFLRLLSSLLSAPSASKTSCHRPLGDTEWMFVSSFFLLTVLLWVHPFRCLSYRFFVWTVFPKSLFSKGWQASNVVVPRTFVSAAYSILPTLFK